MDRKHSGCSAVFRKLLLTGCPGTKVALQRDALSCGNGYLCGVWSLTGHRPGRHDFFSGGSRGMTAGIYQPALLPQWELWGAYF